MTVRERVRAIQATVRDGNLTPDLASDLALKLTALLGNIDAEMIEADIDYSNVLLAAMREEKAANRARLVADTSPEYRRKREAKALRDLTVELVRSLRQMLRTETESMRMTR